MARPPPSPAEMNRANCEFWAIESEKFRKRIKDPGLASAAMLLIEGNLSGLPDCYRTSLEQALEDAERLRPILRRYDGRTGGRPRGGDRLQVLIDYIVSHRPTISKEELLDTLKDQVPGPVVEDIEDDKIHFVAENGRSKIAPVSGLKDRLSRARRASRSQEPV